MWNAAVAAKNGDLFLPLWNGDYENILNEDGTKRYPSHSEAVQALFNFLTFHTLGCRAQVKRMFFQSALSKKLSWHHQRSNWIEGRIDKSFDWTFPEWELNLPDATLEDDDSIPPPVPMSEKAFVGLAGDIVREFEPHSESDRHGLLMSILAMFGAIIGRNPRFPTDGKFQRAKLSVILIGGSGTGRKGTATANIASLFKHVDPKFWKDHRASGLSTGEGLVQRIKDDDNAGAIQDQRLLIIEEEFGSVLSHTKRLGNTLSPFLRMAYDDEPMQILAKHNTDKSSNHHISLIGHITEEELKRELTETDQYNGFFNRLLPVFVQRSKVLPFGGNRDQNRINNLSVRLQLRFPDAYNAQEFTWAEDARPVWAERYEYLTSGRYGLYGALTRRAAPHVIRIALIYALLEGETKFIRKVHLEAALEVWRYVEESIYYIFRDASLFALDNKLLEIIRNAGAVGIPQTGIHKAFGKNKRAREISESLAALEQQGKIRREEQKTNGRPETIWYAA